MALGTASSAAVTAFFNSFNGTTPSAIASYASIYSAQPDPSNTATNQIPGISRQLISWTSPSGNATANTGALTFSNITNKTITHIGVCTALTGGSLLFTVPLSSPVVIGGTARSYTIAPFGLSVLIDSVNTSIVDSIDGGLANTTSWVGVIS